MKTTYRFEPKEDLTVMDLAEIISIPALSQEEFDKLPARIKVHFGAKIVCVSASPFSTPETQELYDDNKVIRRIVGESIRDAVNKVYGESASDVFPASHQIEAIAENYTIINESIDENADVEYFYVTADGKSHSKTIKAKDYYKLPKTEPIVSDVQLARKVATRKPKK